MGWGGPWEGSSEGRGRVYTWLIHGDVWQRPAQCYKAIIKKPKRNLTSD